MCWFQKKIREWVLKEIEKADSQLLSEIVQSVQHRYAALHPEWETVFLSLPKADTQEREEELEKMIRILREGYQSIP